MKKLIAILAVFAVVAGAAFAQDGSWSVGGSGNIGTRLFLEALGDEGGHVSNRANGFNNWQGDAGDVKGSLSVNYSKGGLSAGLSFGQDGAIGTSVSFSGDNLNFKASGDFDVDGSDLKIKRGDLWGNYTFDVLNGLLLELAVNKEPGGPLSATGILGDPYTHHNTVGKAYLYLDLAPMDGLNIGFITPNVFPLSDSDFLTESLQKTVFAAKYSTGPIGASLQFALLGRQPEYKNKDGDVINKIDDLKAGLYLGLSYSINDQMSAGLAFKSEFGGGQKTLKDDYADAAIIGFGASFNFNDGPFGAGITVKFQDDDRGALYADDDFMGSGATVVTEEYDHNQTFSIDAEVSYDLVENYLKFILGAGFTFKDAIEKTEVSGSDTKAVYAGVIDYSFEPQLYFNFLGTGTGNYWGTGTGICVKYRVEGPLNYFEPIKGRNHEDKHYLQITFRWGF